MTKRRNPPNTLKKVTITITLNGSMTDKQIRHRVGTSLTAAFNRYGGGGGYDHVKAAYNTGEIIFEQDYVAARAEYAAFMEQQQQEWDARQARLKAEHEADPRYQQRIEELTAMTPEEIADLKDPYKCPVHQYGACGSSTLAHELPEELVTAVGNIWDQRRREQESEYELVSAKPRLIHRR